MVLYGALTLRRLLEIAVESYERCVPSLKKLMEKAREPVYLGRDKTDLAG